jgi:hypothetical protein
MLVLRARGPNCVARGVGHSFAPIHRGGDKPYGGGSLLQPARVVRTTNRAFRFIASVQTVPSLFVQVRPVRVRATLCAEPSRGFFLPARVSVCSGRGLPLLCVVCQVGLMCVDRMELAVHGF